MSFRVTLPGACLMAAALCLSTTPVWSFGTARLNGAVGHAIGHPQDAEHEKITRLGMAGAGMEPLTLNSFAGAYRPRMALGTTWGAVGAPDNLHRSPDLGSVSEAHCDNGDYMDLSGYPQTAYDAAQQLVSCRTYISTHLTAAITKAGRLVTSSGALVSAEAPTAQTAASGADPVGCNWDVDSDQQPNGKCAVLSELGLAFHAAQDFYSHTNFTDAEILTPRIVTPPKGNPENPPGLGQSGPSAFINPAAPGPFPWGLISGCYHGFPEWAHCNYGALGQKNRVKHDFLNKDHGEIDVATGVIGAGETPRGAVHNNFRHAVEAAIADTRARWQWVAQQIRTTYPGRRGLMIVCALDVDDPPGACSNQAMSNHMQVTNSALSATQMSPVTLNTLMTLDGNDGAAAHNGQYSALLTDCDDYAYLTWGIWATSPMRANFQSTCQAFANTHMAAAVADAGAVAFAIGQTNAAINNFQIIDVPNAAPVPVTYSIGCDALRLPSQQANAKCKVLAELGLAFHALQNLHLATDESGAVSDTRSAWEQFEHDVAFRYPGAQGQMILCAIERDTPANDCNNPWYSGYQFYSRGPNPSLQSPPPGTKSSGPVVIIH